MAKKKSFENIISNILGEPVSNLCHAFYDQYVEANVRFRSKAGMKAVIIRRQLGKCCDWCADLAGIYTPENAPADIYRRHDNCKCMVTYKDEDGYQDVWSKKEFKSQRDARIEKIKTIETNKSITDRRNREMILLERISMRKKYAYCYGDYLRDVLGSAKENYAKELKRIEDDIKSKGGDIIYLKNSKKMATNLRKGLPAIIEVDENISIAGVLHEYRHFLDDLENGTPGFGHYLENSDLFFALEKRGYEEELAIAKEMGYNNIIEKIENEIEKRRKEIYGIE